MVQNTPVGGMPQAVKKYVETKDFDAVDAAKRDVLTIYRNDITYLPLYMAPLL